MVDFTYSSEWLYTIYLWESLDEYSELVFFKGGHAIGKRLCWENLELVKGEIGASI